MSQIQLRPATPADAGICGRIIFDAFIGIAHNHCFPTDFDSVEAATEFARAMISKPTIFAVVAEVAGELVGSNFLDLRDAIAGVGPIAVDPAHQGIGVGRRLMETVIDRARYSQGIRLVQEAFNTVSLSLYTSLGFEVKEPAVVMRGHPTSVPGNDAETRFMEEEDLPCCAALCKRIHGVDRNNELRDSLQTSQPLVLVRDGHIVAYMAAPTDWLTNHGVAEIERDLTDLIIGASTVNPDCISLLVPVRHARLFRWCIKAGLQIVKPMTLMATGYYQEPRGVFFPSAAY